MRYYFKYNMGLPEKSVSSALVFGSSVHRAVERHFCDLLAGNPPPGLNVLLDEYSAG